MSQMDYVQVMVKKQLSIDDTPEQQTSHQSSSLVMKPHLQQELHLNLHKSPKAQKDESTTSTVEEKTEKSEDENDVWNKLKDFAG